MTGDQWVSTSIPYLTPQAGERDAWAEEVASRSRQGSQRIVEAGQTVPPAPVAEALGLSDGQIAVVRRRVMYLDDRPVELTDSYYPLAIAHGTALAQPAKVPGGAITLLAQLGHTAERVREDVTARMPTTQECQALALGEGEPVLILTRLIIDSAGQPVEVSVMTIPARSGHLRYEVKVR